jgi:hypothetical protein
MTWDAVRLAGSPIFGLALAAFGMDSQYWEVIDRWTVMPVTSQLTNPVWVTRIAGTVIPDTSNLDLRSLGKLSFKPRG